MLAYFPRPYPDELLYSVIARYGVHRGILSPTELVKELFLSRNVAAVVDLPGHLNTLVDQIRHLHPYTVEDWIQRHTLYPVYLAFVPAERSLQILRSTCSDKANDIHTRIGMVASSIRPPKYLRICQQCYFEQQQDYGEAYWQRTLQLPGVIVCPLHAQPLSITNVHYRPANKFLFVQAEKCNVVTNFDFPEVHNALPALVQLGKSYHELLNVFDVSPTVEQLGLFYFQLASRHNLTKRTRVDHVAVTERFLNYWPTSLLLRLDQSLVPALSWLTMLFRKQRKVIHPLCHLLVWQCFGEYLTTETFRSICGLPATQEIKPDKQEKHSCTRRLEQERSAWKFCCEVHGKQGIKWMRSQGGASANYAWLYRNDRQWLKQHLPSKIMRITQVDRIDWKKRDRVVLQELKKLKNRFLVEYSCCRMTKSWYIKNVSVKSFLEKNSKQLPKCKKFIEENQETVEAFQYRRISAVIGNLHENCEKMPVWRVLRLAGIRKQFITDDLIKFISEERERFENEGQSPRIC